MNKSEFLSALRKSLSGLPEEDVVRSLDYYSEMIEDRMEDGLSEEQAVGELGTIEEIAGQIMRETPLPKLIREKVRRRGVMEKGTRLLLILGAVVWVPLLLSAAVVLLSVYVVAWSLVVVLYAVVLSLFAGALCGLAGLVLPATGGASRTMCFGAGLACAGLCVLAFFGTNALVGAFLRLHKKCCLALKNSLIQKEFVQ